MEQTFFYDPGQRAPKELAPGIVARTFWGERMLVAVVDLAPDAVLPMHSHPHEQSGVVLSGAITFVVAGETRRLGAGEVYIIPGGVEHRATAGPDGAVVTDVFSPVREEFKY